VKQPKKVKKPGFGEAEEALLADNSVDEAVVNLKSQTVVLQPHERRSWTVFFSLYKNYSAGCGRFWFERQFARIQLRLEKANRPDLLSTLRAWAKHLDVDWSKVQDRFAICMQLLADPTSKASVMHTCGGLHLHVGGAVAHTHAPTCDHHERFLSPQEAARSPVTSLIAVNPDAAQLKMTTAGRFPEDIAVVTVNPQFEQLFGLSQDVVTKMTQIMGSGLLPWGGDLLCMVVPNEADVFAFMQICAINLNWMSLCSQSKFPVVREVPSVHVFTVNTARVATPIPCLVKCVHRELIDLERGITLDVTMTFEPMVQLQSLSAASSTSPTTPQQFEQELPLADDGFFVDGNPSNGLKTVSGYADPTIDEVFFPDIDIQVGDDDEFLGELLDFARLGDGPL
jgi:hypothetical protein